MFAKNTNTCFTGLSVLSKMTKTVKKGSKIDDFRVPIFMYFGGPTRSCRGMLGMTHGDIPGYRTGVSWVWTYTRDHPRGPVSRGLKRVQKGVPKMVIFDPPKITDFGPYFRPSRRCERCDTHVKKCKKRARSWRGNGTFCISRFRKNTTNRGKRSRPCIQGVRKSSILDLFRSKNDTFWTTLRTPGQGCDHPDAGNPA